MYNPKYFLLLLWFAIFSFVSCKKYVEVKPEGQITPTTVNDYQLLLNNSTVFNVSSGTTDFVTDDIALIDTGLISSIQPVSLLNIYEFKELFYQTSENDPDWNAFYQQIYTANIAIQGLPSATSGAPGQAQKLIAEAKVHRAYAYLCLVNQYAAVYNASNVDKAPGVPLLLVPTYTQSLQRASEATIYNQILSDLNTSLAALPNLPVNNTDPSKTAVYALLARTYLYMGDYANALKNADLALSLQSTLLSLNSELSNVPPGFFYPVFYFPLSQDNPETILLKAADNQDAPLNLSSELLNLLGPNDLRTYFFTYNGPDLGYYPGTYYAYSPYESRNQGPTVSEMMLIEAECLARSQQGQQGLAVVNVLRQNRFKPSDYTPLTAANDQAALVLILQERRRELFAKGFRLFDLKRYNTDPTLAKTITHPLNGAQLTLAPGSNRYVYPIATNVISANPEITQNPR
jgi:hypothetical protein